MGFGIGASFVIRNSGFVILDAHACSFLIERLDPRTDEVPRVMIRASAEHVLVDDAGFVHIDAAADFEVKFALRDGGHAQAFDDVGTGGDLHAVADAGAGLFVIPEPFGDAEEIGVFADVFRGTAAAEEDADVFLRVDVFEGDVGVDAVAFPLLGDGPAGLHFMQHHLVFPLFRRSDDWLVAAFDEAIKRIQGINGLGGVTDDEEDFGFRHEEWSGGVLE